VYIDNYKELDILMAVRKCVPWRTSGANRIRKLHHGTFQTGNPQHRQGCSGNLRPCGVSDHGRDLQHRRSHDPAFV